MESLYTPRWEKDKVGEEEEEEEENTKAQGEAGMEASSPIGSTDEETEEDLEPEPPLVIRRKVSFADAFGLDLVSVKEFDNVDVTESGVSEPPDSEVIGPSEEFYLSCLFTTPSTPEELDQRLEEQRIELESVELLPGTTTLRGIIRVVNLTYSKSVYVRITLDSWTSQFDLLAEYVPGSSDRKTDRFAFKYSLVPPFDRDGIRMEFCLRYETPVGTFWANNKDLNYVLFCHRKVREVKAKDQGPHVAEESASLKGKRSCLKPNRKGSEEEKMSETVKIETASVEAAAAQKAEEADRKTADNTEIQSLLQHEEHKPSLESIKSRHRATNLAGAQDYFSHRRQQAPKASSADSANGLADFQPHMLHHQHHPSPLLPAPWGSSTNLFRIRQKKRSSQRRQVLTYHQIPLLTLDWSDDKPQHLGTADAEDMWTGIKTQLSKSPQESKDNTPSVSELWEAFLNGTDEDRAEKSSVCDIWQAFLNGPDCKDHSGLPESEWLQTAASVSPSNHKEEPQAQYAVSEEQHTSQVGTDTPAYEPTHTSAEWQPVSHTPTMLSAIAAFNAEEQQPAEVCVSAPRDDNVAAHDASQKAETSHVTDTLQEFGLTGAALVSEGSVDSSTQWHKHAVWEREREGKIVRAGGGGGGGGGDEPLSPYIADLVTSSGDRGTTEMTAMPESQNASAVDRISQGARLAEGLSSSGEGEVTGTAHNATDDMLAFRETIRQGTKDGGRFVLFTSRQGVEEGFTPNCAEEKVYTEKEIFRPQESDECEISQRYADEKKCEEFRPNQNSENALKQKETDEDEMRHAQSHADEFEPNQTHQGNFRQRQIMASESKSQESEHDEVASNNKDLEEFERTKTAGEVLHCPESDEAKRQVGAEVEISQVTDEEAWQRNEKALQENSSVRQWGDTLMISIAPDEQSRPNPAVEELHTHEEKEEENLTLTQTEESEEMKCGETAECVIIPNQMEEGTSQSHAGIIQIAQGPCRGINPSVQTQVFKETQTAESIETEKVLRSDQEGDGLRAFQIDECEPNPTEMVELGWTQTQVVDVESHKVEDVGGEINPQEATVKEKLAKKDNSTDLQHQPEILKEIEEDMNQRGKDERVSTGKLKMEASEVSMGDPENTQEEGKNAKTELKEQELPIEKGESSPHIECKIFSAGTKDTITANDIVALELIEPGVEEIFTERLGQDLVEGSLGEVLDQIDDVHAFERNGDIVEGTEGGLVDMPGLIHDNHLTKAETLSEPDLNEAFDSGVFSLTELETDPNFTASLDQCVNHSSATSSDKPCSIESSHSLTKTPQTLSCLMPTVDTSPSGEETTETDVPPKPPLLVKDQESFSQIKERLVSHQEIHSQSDDCAAVQKEGFNQPAHPSYESPSPSSEKLDEASALVWWSVLYFICHVTRTLVCALLVAAFFVITLLYDFPACFALYVFSLCWWFGQWKRHRVTVTKGMVE